MPAVPFTEWAPADFADLHADLHRAQHRLNQLGEDAQPWYAAALVRTVRLLEADVAEAAPYERALEEAAA